MILSGAVYDSQSGLYYVLLICDLPSKYSSRFLQPRIGGYSSLLTLACLNMYELTLLKIPERELKHAST